MEPIFIVGVPRSGTTLLAAMLAAHSRLSCGPESHFFRNLWRVKPKWLCEPRVWPNRAVDFLFSITHVGKPVPENYGITGEEIAQYLRSKRPCIPSVLSSLTEQYMVRNGKKRWVEKTPDHLPHVCSIRRYFPRSSVVRIVRDARDVALSLLDQPWGPGTFLEGMVLWQAYEERSADFFESDALSCTVRYEDLVLEPEKELRKLCGFLNEPFEPGMLDTSESALHVNRAREPWKEKAGSALDVKRVALWKTRLTREENRQAEAISGGLLMAHGYPCDNREARRFVSIYPMQALGKYPEVAEILAQRGARFWRRDADEKPDLKLYLGDPDHHGWLGGRRWKRIVNTLAIGFDALRARMLGPAVYWMGDGKENGMPGRCSRLLHLLIGGPKKVEINSLLE